MELRIKQRFNDSILAEARRRYNIAASNLHLLDGFESFIYEFTRDNEAYILRLAHSSRRNEALIHGEVDWINYLAAGGTSVASAILSEAGKLVEAIDDGSDGCFLATAFVKAQGRPAWEVGWTPAVYETYGRLIGRMHRLTKRYTLPDPSWKRPEWHDDIMLDGERNLPASEEIALQKFQQEVVYLHTLPKDTDTYGLIHFDAHPMNFFVDDSGHITLFDFDDCCYHWFVNDMAIVLFYMVTNQERPEDITHAFLPHFLRGYRRENYLHPRWLQEIPHFLKFREIDLYGLIHRSFDVANLQDQWCLHYMWQRKERIEQDVPYINLDFSAFAEYLE